MRYLIVLILMPIIQLGISFVGTELLALESSFQNIYGLAFAQQLFAVFLPTYLLFHKKSYLPKSEISSISMTECLRFAVMGICLQFVGIAANLPISVMLQKMGAPLPPALPMARSFAQFCVQTVVACLCPAIFEEVLFRRMMFLEMRKKSQIAAVCFSALFFSMAHMDFFNFPAMLFIGLCLGIVRTQNIPLIYCIITHFFVNFSASVLNHLLKSQVLNSLFQRYLLLWVAFAFILLVTVFPKKKGTSLSGSSQKFVRYICSLLKNPLFYIYCIFFAVVGVSRL